MNLNPKKCEEMLVCPLECAPDLAPLLNGVSLGMVASHKVLSATIMGHIKWNKNIDEIIGKASKRLHIIRVLKVFQVYNEQKRRANGDTALLNFCCSEPKHACLILLLCMQITIGILNIYGHKYYWRSYIFAIVKLTMHA